MALLWRRLFFPLQLHLIVFVCALLHTRTLVTHHASILFFRIRFLLNLTLWNHKTLRKDLKDIWHLFFCDPVLPYTAQLFYKWVLLYLTLTFFLTHLTGQTEGIVILCAFSIVDGWWCIFFCIRLLAYKLFATLFASHYFCMLSCLMVAPILSAIYLVSWILPSFSS